MYYDSRGKKPEICLTGQSCVSKAAFLSGGAKGKSSFFPFFTLLGLTLGCRIFNLCCSMQELLVVACELRCGMWDLVP